MSSLRDFLKKEKILTRFKKNMECKKSKDTWLELNKDNKNAISNAFVWKETNESHSFWLSIQVEWSKNFE